MYEVEIEKKKKSDVREYIGLLKWFFEVADKIRVNWNAPMNESFNSIVKDFKSSVLKKR